MRKAPLADGGDQRVPVVLAAAGAGQRPAGSSTVEAVVTVAKRRPRDIGTAFETQVRGLFQSLWPGIRRTETTTRYGGAPDFTDDRGDCPWAVEAKASQKREINPWWEQTVASAEKVDGLPLLVMRRKGHPGNPFVLTDWQAFKERERLIAGAEGDRVDD